ncbi:cysteine-rich motor neuron 1 protein-like isoform X2 [Lineus longissimus]|uniref:cysteine-rich motor neuron 1 protein-like isoform X2 n=1 Tax=Lineus longissimus TaxID=88925 RepID=UPI00315DA972
MDCQIYGFLVFVFLCGLHGGAVRGQLVCNDCDTTLCEKPVDCPGDIILDQCRCCHVCARMENDTCGGPFDAFGRCADGLVCFGSIQSLDTLFGVCKPKDFKPENRTDVISNILEEEIDPCADIRCQVVFAPRCPSDSKAIGGNILPGECCPSAAKCVCNYLECLNPVCSAGYNKVVTSRNTGVPGRCCDIYECRPINDPCAKVECEEIDQNLKCPADSFKLPSIPSADGCCLVQQGCTCRPKTACTAPSCPEGLKVQILEAASEKPGKCCDTFKCYNGSMKMCDYLGIKLLDGESITVDKCTKCRCENGLSMCQTETCNDIPLCGWLETPAGECCPVCQGCLASSGKAYKNGEQWNEGNDCVHCHCVDGEVYCQAEMCAVHCSKPRKIPGQCCQVCDDPEVVTVAPNCPRMDNCTRLCAAGWDKDDRGCYICSCRPPLCDLKCPYGFRLDQDGNQVCNCVDPPPGCMTLKRCTKSCIYGYKRGKNGCLKCRCNTCPFFSCQKNCTFGYAVNSEGCRICKCQERTTTVAPTEKATTIAMIQRPSISPQMCLSSEGRVFDDGESWYDGCRHCYCHRGQEMCALITCPGVNCINPIIRMGDCCPSCPGDDLSGPAVVPSKCFSYKGEYKAEGETWAMDECTECICHNSNVLCEMERCLPLPCKQPVKLPGMCCPICKENEISIDVPETNQSCSSVNGGSYRHGDTWRTNPCMSCTCRHGQIHCFSQTCPILKCNNTVLRKGQCCPYCFDPEPEDTGKCKYHETLYDPGERWSPTLCKRCRCSKGRVKCHEKVCAKMDNCALSHIPPGECCPVCSEFKVKKANKSKTESRERKTANVSPHDNTTEDDNGGQIEMTIIAILVTIIAVLSLVVLALFIVCIRRRNRHSVDIDSVPKSRSHDRNLNNKQNKNPKRAKRDEKPPRRRPPSCANVDLTGVLDSSQPDIISVKGMDPYKLSLDDSGRHLERGGITTFTSDKEYVEDSKRRLPDKYKPNSECAAIIHVKKSPQKSSDV